AMHTPPIPAIEKKLKRQNLPMRIAQLLREELMVGRLLPGQALILREVAERFDVSQTPVREALLLLTSEGALEMLPGHSASVPQLSIATILELRAIRVNLEGMAIESACAHITSQDIDVIRSHHVEMLAEREKRNIAGILNANTRFHLALYQHAKMPVLNTIIQHLWVRTAPYLNYMYAPDLPPPSGDYPRHPHLEILDALQKRDTAAAKLWLERDIRLHENRLI